MWRRFSIFAIAFFLLAAISLFSAFAAGISIPPVNIDYQPSSVNPDDFKPSECAGITLTNLVTGTGTITGTTGNDLILGSAAADTIDGLGGDDCILSGGGDDSITGGDGTADICIGGPDNDSFTTCEAEYP
jgi:hypothetical protein